jgi:two-component system, sensor histidine kinase
VYLMTTFSAYYSYWITLPGKGTMMTLKCLEGRIEMTSKDIDLLHHPERPRTAGKIFNMKKVKTLKEQLKALRGSENKYYSLFMNMESPICYNRILLDEIGNPVDFQYIEVNDAFANTVGMRKDDMIGRKFSELFPTHAESFEFELKVFYEVALKGTTFTNDDYYDAVQGRWYTTSIYSPEKSHFVIVMNEITDKKVAEELLKRSKEEAEKISKIKSEFLANMSHEIRTPINGIVGMIDLTLMTELNEDQRENLTIAKSCTSSLLNIINDILDFSKMEAGKLTINNIGFNISTLMDEIIKSQAVYAKEKGLELSFRLCSSIPSNLIGDPNRLKQVLNNLISNGIKFTDTGRVYIEIKKVTALEEEVQLRFSVKDTGIGISAEGMRSLFKSFSQLDNSYTRKFGGTGLGLVISKQLTEMMGGRMWTESKKDEGSIFYFTLPFKVGEKAVKDYTEVPVIHQHAKTLDILLVEDDRINQVVFTNMLKKKEYRVDTVGSGLEALDAHKNKRYDLILMDIQMPEMDGVEASKRIRKAEGPGKYTPIIALTAFALNGDRERFMSMGMDEYISKPVSMDKLLEVISYVVSKEKPPLNCSGKPEKSVIGTPCTTTTSTTDKPKLESVFLLQEIDVVINDLVKVMGSSEFAEIESVAHKLKGIFQHMELDRMKGLAFKIELAARRRSFKEIAENLGKVKGEFEAYKRSVRLEENKVPI